MKLYFVRNAEKAFEFCGTQSDAKKSVKKFAARNTGVNMEPMEVPTNKPDLIKWLNEWIDNGEK
jgi:hypothetical protein